MKRCVENKIFDDHQPPVIMAIRFVTNNLCARLAKTKVTTRLEQDLHLSVKTHLVG